MTTINDPVQHTLYNNRITLFVFIIIVLLGAWLRFFHIGYQSLWIDESFSVLAAEKVSQTGTPLLDSGRMYSRSKPHIYLTSLVYSIAGRDVSSLRAPSAFFGTALIILVFFFSRSLYESSFPALIAALLLSTSYFEIAWSRQIRMYIEFQFFYTLTTLLYYQCIGKQKSSNVLVAAAFFSTVITIMLHASGVLILIPLVVLLVIYYNNVNFFIKMFFLSIAVCVLFFYCTVHANNIDILYVFSEKNIFISKIRESLMRFDHYITFISKKNTLYSLLSFVMAFLSILRLEKESIFLVSTFIVSILLISTQNVLIMRGLFFLLPILIILSSRCIYLIYQQTIRFLYEKKLFKTHLASGKQPLIYGGISIIVAISPVLTSIALTEHHVFIPQKNYFLEYDPYFKNINIWDYTPQPDFNSAYNYIQQHRQKNDIFLVAHTAIHNWYMPNTEAYWLGFLFIDKPGRKFFYLDNPTGGKTEGYLGLPIIATFTDLQNILLNHHGFVIIDYFAMSTDIPGPFVQYLLEKAPIRFTSELGKNMPWNRVWVGRF